MPLLAQCVDHPALNWPAAGPTDGDTHLVMARQAEEFPLQLPGLGGQLLPGRQHRASSVCDLLQDHSNPWSGVPCLRPLLWLSQLALISGDFLCAPQTGPRAQNPRPDLRKMPEYCPASFLRERSVSSHPNHPPKPDWVSGASTEGTRGACRRLSASLSSTQSQPYTCHSFLYYISTRVPQSRGTESSGERDFPPDPTLPLKALCCLTH